MELLRPTNDDDGEIGEFVMNERVILRKRSLPKKKKKCSKEKESAGGENLGFVQV